MSGSNSFSTGRTDRVTAKQRGGPRSGHLEKLGRSLPNTVLKQHFECIY